MRWGEVRWDTIWRETVASGVCQKILSGRCDCTCGLPLFHAKSCFISPHLTSPHLTFVFIMSQTCTLMFGSLLCRRRNGQPRTPFFSRRRRWVTPLHLPSPIFLFFHTRVLRRAAEPPCNSPPFKPLCLHCGREHSPRNKWPFAVLFSNHTVSSRSPTFAVVNHYPRGEAWGGQWRANAHRFSSLGFSPCWICTRKNCQQNMQCMHFCCWWLLCLRRQSNIKRLTYNVSDWDCWASVARARARPGRDIRLYTNQVGSRAPGSCFCSQTKKKCLLISKWNILDWRCDRTSQEKWCDLEWLHSYEHVALMLYSLPAMRTRAFPFVSLSDLQGVCLPFERLWNLTRKTFAHLWSPSKFFTLKNLVKKSLEKIWSENAQKRRPRGSSIKRGENCPAKFGQLCLPQIFQVHLLHLSEL